MTQPANRRLVTEDKFLPVQSTANAAYTAVTNSANLSPNYIINGAFDFWQRGTSFSNPANSSFTADRWAVRRDGTGFTSSISKYVLSSSELNGTGLYNALIYSVTNAGSSNTYNQIINRIEDVRSLEGQNVTVSFWAKNVSGSATIQPIIQNYYGTDGSAQVFNSGTAITLTSSWARYSQTISVTSAAGKTISANSYAGLIFSFPSAATMQVALTGVQVEAGSVATAFRRNANSLQGELAACQRYFETGKAFMRVTGVPTGSSYYQTFWKTPFKVTKRASATLATTITSGASFGFSADASELYATAYANGTTDVQIALDWTATAEL